MYPCEALVLGVVVEMVSPHCLSSLRSVGQKVQEPWAERGTNSWILGSGDEFGWNYCVDETGV